jgi:hypothetical protein
MGLQAVVELCFDVLFDVALALTFVFVVGTAALKLGAVRVGDDLVFLVGALLFNGL